MDQIKYIEIRKQLDFKKQPSKLLAHLVTDSLLITGVVALFMFSKWAHLIISPFTLAVFFFRSFGLMHEAVHSSISGSKRLNNWIGYIYGGFCFLPFKGWKDIHLRHHRWSSNVDKDPTMALLKDYNPNKYVQNNIKNFIWKSWVPILGFLQYIVFWKYNITLFKDKIRQKHKVQPVIMSFLIPAFIYASTIYFAGHVFHLKVILPALFIYFTMVEIINFPHHLGLSYRSGNNRLMYKDQYQISRSCYYPSWFARNILLNFNYHIEHHLYPDLPWYQLDRARNIIRPLLGDAYNNVKGNTWIIEKRKKRLDGVILTGYNYDKIKVKKAA